MLAPSAAAWGIHTVAAAGALLVRAGAGLKASRRPDARAVGAWTPRPSNAAAVTNLRRRTTPGTQPTRRRRTSASTAPASTLPISTIGNSGPSPPLLAEPVNALNTLAAGDNPSRDE